MQYCTTTPFCISINTPSFFARNHSTEGPRLTLEKKPRYTNAMTRHFLCLPVNPPHLYGESIPESLVKNW